MAKKTTKEVKRRLVFTVPITLTIILFTTISSVSELIKIKKYNEEEKQLTAELEALKEETDNLNTEISKLSSPDYIARYAREKYLYTKDGEKVVIVDIAEEEKEIIEKEKEINYVIYALIASGLLLLILIIILIRKMSKKRKSTN